MIICNFHPQIGVDQLMLLENSSPMKKVFLTFADGGENFIAARDRIVREAKETGQFAEIRAYDWSNVSCQEIVNSPLRQYKRGCGYWIWKPAVIYSVLQELEDGDILVYCDCGDSLHKATMQWRKFFAHLEKVDIICRRISACNVRMCRKELLESFSKERLKCRLCYQFEMGSVFMRKTPFVMKLIEDWLFHVIHYPDEIRDVIGEVEVNRQLPTFIENRHDQAVFSLLLASRLSDPSLRNKIKTVWEFHEGCWLFGPPCIDVSRNRSGDICRLSFRVKIKRLAYRIMWRLHLMLERKGLCLFWEKGGYYGA